MSQSDPPAPWPSGTCTVGTVQIHYLRTGREHPPLVALHGLMSSGACWTPLAHALEQMDLVMPDARGHGLSSTPTTGYRYSDHARDVLGLIRTLALPSPVLLGHSMGGMTAALAASQLGTEVRGVILVDPTFISPEMQQEVFESDMAEQHRRALELDRHELIVQARRRHPRRLPELIDLMAEARHRTSMHAFEVLIPPNPDFRQLIRSVRAPIHLVLAETGVVSLETAQELQALNARLTYEVIPGVGHAVPYDAPERLSAAVSTFVRSLPAHVHQPVRDETPAAGHGTLPEGGA